MFLPKIVYAVSIDINSVIRCSWASFFNSAGCVQRDFVVVVVVVNSLWICHKSSSFQVEFNLEKKTKSHLEQGLIKKIEGCTEKVQLYGKMKYNLKVTRLISCVACKPQLRQI